MRWPDKPSRPADNNSILAPGETDTEWDKADEKQTKNNNNNKNKNNKTRKRNKVQSNVATNPYAVGP